MLINSRLIRVHFASRGIVFPFESRARIELLGLLLYALGLDEEEVLYCSGEILYCDGSGTKVVLVLEATDCGTCVSTDDDDLESIRELEGV